ncbi:MAG: orotidine-5'-phosphate decarboxylase [Pseudomonadales bacterium]|nr:orotidine-5'-phosphate decarboxylase [Pseudomonadales bacterium]
MPRVPFIEQLRRRWRDTDSSLCIGLDPDPARLPESLAKGPGAFLAFCTAIVDATADLVCAFKPQIAYFAAHGRERELVDLIAYIHTRHPGVPVILDAKRGDIGDTARLYAIEAYERYDADAVTVNPYLGHESVEPFLDWEDRGVVLLCRTSNPGSGWLQTHPSDAPLFLRVAEGAREWNRHGNVMLVAGATYPEDLAKIRAVVGDDVPLLVPGIGAQGGDLAAVIHNGAGREGQGLVINVSRTVLYAGRDAAFARAARTAAVQLRDEIRHLQRVHARSRN